MGKTRNGRMFYFFESVEVELADEAAKLIMAKVVG